MHKIAVVNLNLRELAAVDASVCFVLKQMGPKIKDMDLECYEALTGAKSKLEKLAAHDTATMSA